MRRRPAGPPLFARRRKPQAEIARNTYILDDKKNVVRCLDLELWGRWFDEHDGRCVVGRVDFLCDLTIVETRFIGIDLAVDESLGPLVFETLIDGGEMHGYRALWASWRDAADGHAEACHLVRETFN